MFKGLGFKGLGLGVRGLRFRHLKGSLTCQCQQGRFQLGPISTYPAFYGSVGCISLRGFKREPGMPCQGHTQMVFQKGLSKLIWSSMVSSMVLLCRHTIRFYRDLYGLIVCQRVLEA